MNKKNLIRYSCAGIAFIGAAYLLQGVYISQNVAKTIKTGLIKTKEIKNVGNVSCHGGMFGLTCNLKNVILSNETNTISIPSVTIVNPRNLVRNKEILLNGKDIKKGYSGKYIVILKNIKVNGISLNEEAFKFNKSSLKNPAAIKKSKELLRENLGNKNKVVFTNEVNVARHTGNVHTLNTFSLSLGKFSMSGKANITLSNKAASIRIKNNFPNNKKKRLLDIKENGLYLNLLSFSIKNKETDFFRKIIELSMLMKGINNPDKKINKIIENINKHSYQGQMLGQKLNHSFKDKIIEILKGKTSNISVIFENSAKNNLKTMLTQFTTLFVMPNPKMINSVKKDYSVKIK